MFSYQQKKWLAGEVEKLILSLNHPEMPKERPNFTLHVDGKEQWSWADIDPNWKFDDKNQPTINIFNELNANPYEIGESNAPRY